MIFVSGENGLRPEMTGNERAFQTEPLEKTL